MRRATLSILALVLALLATPGRAAQTQCKGSGATLRPAAPFKGPSIRPVGDFRAQVPHSSPVGALRFGPRMDGLATAPSSSLLAFDRLVPKGKASSPESGRLLDDGRAGRGPPSKPSPQA